MQRYPVWLVWVVIACFLTGPAGLAQTLPGRLLIDPSSKDDLPSWPAGSEQQQALAGQWLVKQNPRFDPTGPYGRRFVVSMVQAIQPSDDGLDIKSREAEWHVGLWNQWLGLSHQVLASDGPSDWKQAMVDALFNRIVIDRIPVDADLVKDCWSSITAPCVPLAASESQAMIASLVKAYPDFARLGPMQQKAVLDLLAAMNPGLAPVGLAQQVGRAPSWSGPVVSCQLPGDVVRIYRYRLNPAVPLVLPGISLLKQTASSAGRTAVPSEAVIYRPKDRRTWVIRIPDDPENQEDFSGLLYLFCQGDTVLSASLVRSGSDVPEFVNVATPAPKPTSTKAKVDLSDVDPDLAELMDEADAIEKKKQPKSRGRQAESLTGQPAGMHDDPLWPRRVEIDNHRLVGLLGLGIRGKEIDAPEGEELYLDMKIQGDRITGQGIKRRFRKNAVRWKQEVKLEGVALSDDQPVPAVNRIPAAMQWPQFRGRLVVGVATPTAAKMIDDLKSIRLAWIGNDRTPAGEWSDMRSALLRGLPIMGGFASPIVADGKVYLSYYRPAGGHFWQERVAAHAYRGVAKNRYQVLADDVLVCLDASTGRTLWKTVMPAKGMNWGSFHKNGYQCTPVYDRGRVYWIGTTGRLYAVDGATGMLIWETDIGARALNVQADAAGGARSGSMVMYSRDFNANPIMVDGVLIVVDHANHQAGSKGLIGVDPVTGSHLWQVRNCVNGRSNQPLMATVDGKQYVVAIDRGTGIRVIDPKTGRIVHKLDAGYNSIYTAVAQGPWIVCHSRSVHKIDEKNQARGVVCFRITDQGIVRQWELDPKTYGRAVNGFVIDQGRVYFTSRMSGKLHVADLSSGQILAEVAHEGDMNGEHDNSTIMIMNGLVLVSNGRQADGLRVYTSDPKDLRSLGLWHLPVTGGYACAVEPALVDGRVIVRLIDRLACYDFRRRGEN